LKALNAKQMVPKKPLVIMKNVQFAAHTAGSDGGDIDNVEHNPDDVSDTEGKNEG
jgi:hypothetical protein